MATTAEGAGLVPPAASGASVGRRATTKTAAAAATKVTTAPTTGARRRARAASSERTFAGLAFGLGNVVGAERRFQRIGEAGGVTIIDDYAHHPTEISATVAAARALFPGRRLVVAFQPHLYSRTRDFAREFACALCASDAVYLTGIYAAREQPIAGVSADLIADAFGAERRKLAWQGERAQVLAALRQGVTAGDVVITMGAGDITRVAPELLEQLARAQ